MKNLISVCFVLLALAVPSRAQQSVMTVNKTAAYDYEKHEGEITLEAYLTGSRTAEMKTVPADVVLILDWSTSMWDHNRITNLTSAATSFVDKIASLSSSGCEHRVSVVTFATGATMRTDFVSMSNSTNVANVKSIIADYGAKSDSSSKKEKVREGSSTQWHLAMCLAYNILRGGIVHTRFYSWRHEVMSGSSSTTANYGENYNSRTESQDYCHNVNVDHNNFSNNYIFSKESNKLSLDEWAQEIYNAGKDRDKDGKYEDKRGNRVENLGGRRAGAKGFVVFFTDGEPTGVRSAETASGKDATDFNTYYDGSNNPNYVVANIATNYAYKIKSDPDNRIYSIKLGTISNGKMDAFADDALKNISSMYPQAERYGTSYRGTASGESSAFFQKVTDGTNTLEIAFNNIASEIKEIVDTKCDVNESNIDFINNAYFKLPDNAQSRIHVYENDLKSFSDGAYTFYPETDSAHWKEITDKVTVLVVPDGDGKGNTMVDVYGYDYAAHWCGMDEAVNPAAVHGSRIVIKIPFVFSNGEKPGNLATNTTDSGVFPVKRDKDGKPVTDPSGVPVPDMETSSGGKSYEVPVIKFCVLTVERMNLDPGESAVYVVTDAKGKTMCKLTLGGIEGGAKVSKSIFGFPGGDGVKYTVTETAWNWAYDKTPAQITKTVSDPDVPVVFTFSGEHKVASEGPAETHNHGESFKVNVMPLPR